MIVKTFLLTLTQKKARTLLLLFSIAISGALLFANLGFQKTMEHMIYTYSIRWSGNSDLYITPKQSAGSWEWINHDQLKPYRNELLYDFSLVRTKALYAPTISEMQYFTALGVDIDEFNTYNPLEIQSGNTDDWIGSKLIMGATFAKKLGFVVGDMISLEIDGKTYDFEISGISQPNGLFSRELADGGFLLMPRETLSTILGGSCNLIFLKANDTSSVQDLKQNLIKALPQYVVHTGVDHAIIQAETTNYTLPFWISSIMVLFMSVFIIYSSFNLIVNERISIIGIMRSVGCTRRKTNLILILESTAIGAVGGTMGCVLGIGVLHLIMNFYFSGENAVINAPILFGVREVFFTIIASTIITVLSAMLPIMKITKIPIKSIILNDFQKQKLKNARYWPIGFALLILCSLVFLTVNIKSFVGMILTSIAVILTLIGLNIIIPLLCHLIAFLCQRLPHHIALGFRNVSDFQALLNNTRLVATTIAIMVLMMTIFHTLGSDLRSIYERERYDILLGLRESSTDTLAKLSQTDGVTDYYCVYETPAAINNQSSFMNAVFGIDSSDYFSYSPAGITPDALQAIETLGDGYYIVTTDILREKLDLSIGDTLTLQFDNGAFDFQITGFLDTNYGIGHVGFISAENYKTVMGASDYSKIFVRTSGDAYNVKNKIMRTLSKDALSIHTKQELEFANADKIEGIFGAINTYAYFAMLIGAFGIINNMAACFLGRRRNLALYRCVGMTAKNTALMLMVEATSIGIIGTFAGLSAGILMMQGIPNLVGMMWGNVAVSAPTIRIMAMCAVGIAVMLACSIVPFIKGKNITIMDNIRYE